jgi:hypothetical protein
MKSKRPLTIVALFTAEVMFVLMGLAPFTANLQSERWALFQYLKTPTAENRSLWLKQKGTTMNMGRFIRLAGGGLSILNGILIVRLLRAH